MKFVIVPHGAKVTGVSQYPAELAADPPMTMDGKAKILTTLVPLLRRYGPFNATFSSLMDRACGTMCTVIKALGLKRVVCIDELGQYGNLDSDGASIAYPGHENDNVLTWQEQGHDAMFAMWDECNMNDSTVVLVFTHRPILAGLIAEAQGITDTEGIKKILDDKGLTGQGFRVFQFDGSNLTIEV